MPNKFSLKHPYNQTYKPNPQYRASKYYEHFPKNTSIIVNDARLLVSQIIEVSLQIGDRCQINYLAHIVSNT